MRFVLSKKKQHVNIGGRGSELVDGPQEPRSGQWWMPKENKRTCHLKRRELTTDLLVLTVQLISKSWRIDNAEVQDDSILDQF